VLSCPVSQFEAYVFRAETLIFRSPKLLGRFGKASTVGNIVHRLSTRVRSVVIDNTLDIRIVNLIQGTQQ
jgi:hypothetical protein